METRFQRPKGRKGTLSSLNTVIDAVNLAKEVSGIPIAKAAFDSVSALLTMIRDSMVNELDYIELGLHCADICRALDRGINGKKLSELSQSVCDAINQLTATVAEIRRKVIKQGRQGVVSRFLRAESGKEEIATWKEDLDRILRLFNTELAVNTHVIVSDVHHSVANTQTMVSEIHRSMLGSQGAVGDEHQLAQASIPGELPPPQPKTFFGRDELVEEIISLAENLTPTALIGAGGIGKTSIALAVLHNDRIKQRFGSNRRFIRCDQFPASRAHFLSRLSKVIGAGVENPEDLTSLRPFLSSREMIIFLDNAESILDPQGADAREIYATVEELSQFGTICLCITSRISTVPVHCKRPTIQTLSMHAARGIFYGTYDDSGRPDIINDLLRRLDFHALSITLLATVASHNMWDYDRLTKEWDAHHTKVLRTDYNESLAATIELSLASPTFRELSPAARDLLGVVAFFPQGIDEKNLGWLFPTTPDRKNIFDKFCALSLTYRSNGFITMLAPLRDYLCSKDPASSPLLCAAKERYFRRLSVWLTPYNPRFEEARWITSEDVNVEHLLVVFTSIDANSEGVWDACTNFIRHLYWHKRRLVVLGSKIEGLPDNHPSKPQCLVELSQLFDSVGIPAECKRLLTHALKLRRERGDDTQVALILRFLSDANRLLNLEREGIQQAEEALKIYERLGNESGQGYALKDLAWLLYQDRQLDAAEEAGTRAIDLLLGEGIQFAVCTCYRVLGLICCSKGEAEKATNHFEAALEIASSFSWHDQQFWCLYSLGQLFLGRGRFDDAHANVELAKSHVANDAYLLVRAAHLKARLWCGQHRLEEAKSEASCAADVFERLGSAKDLVVCGRLLRRIEEEMDNARGAKGSRLANLLRRVLLQTANHASGRVSFP